MRSATRSTRATLAACSVVALAMLGLTGCSMSGGNAAEGEAPAMTESAEPTEEATEMDPAADLVGPGCAAYAEQVPDGPGSVVGMSHRPGRRRGVEQPRCSRPSWPRYRANSTPT